MESNKILSFEKSKLLPGEFCQRFFPEWKNLKLKQIKVIDSSGGSKNKTYKITAPANPSVIGLHVIDQETYLEKDPDFLPRLLEALKLFEKSNLTTHLHFFGKDFFILDWEGETINHPKIKEEITMEEFGKFVAQIHKLPTDWFDPFRKKMRAKCRFLNKVPDGSYMWWYMCNYKDFVRNKTDIALDLWASMGPYPRTEAGKRLVTSNFSLHQGNIIKTDEKLKVIDFDHAVVNHAIQDLSWVFAEGLKEKSLEDKRTFVKTYLEESELPASEKDVDDLILDAQICRVSSCFFDSLFDHICRKNFSEYKRVTKKIEDVYNSNCKKTIISVMTHGLHGERGRKKKSKSDDKEKKESVKKEGVKEETKVENEKIISEKKIEIEKTEIDKIENENEKNENNKENEKLGSKNINTVKKKTENLKNVKKVTLEKKSGLKQKIMK